MTSRLPGHFLVLVLLLMARFLYANQEQALPMNERWVRDEAGVLSLAEENVLSRKLWDVYTRTSTQIVVAIYPELPPNSYMEEFAAGKYQEWGIGREKEDNGVLLAVFIKDRKLRIEVGYGLEEVLTDLQSKRIIDYVITPQFRQQNYYEGITSGVDAILDAVEGKFQIPQDARQPDSGLSDMIPFLIMLLIVIIIIRSRQRYSTTYSRRGSRRHPWDGPVIFPPFGGGGSGGGSSGGGFGGFSGGGGMSGGGGASGGW